MNAKLFKVSLLTACVFLATTGPATATSYTLTYLGTPGITGSFFRSVGANSINNSGQVVGYANYQNENPSHYYATVWNGTTSTQLYTAIFSMANGINDSGQVAGWRDSSATVWNGTTPTDLLGLEFGSSGAASAINNSGQVAGYSRIDSTHNYTRATVWNGTIPTELGTLGGDENYATDINNAGQVVGYGLVVSAPNQRVFHAIVWNGTTPTDLDAAGGDQRSSEAFGINDSGQSVGMSELNAGRETHATLWNGTTPTDLGTLDGYISFALGINNSSQVVGWSNSLHDPEIHHATIWDGAASHTPTDLNNFMDASEVSAGWYFEEARGINDNGWIVGIARNVNADHHGFHETRAFLLTPVPEPETYALFMAGLGLMGFIARRRKNGQS